MIGALGAGSFLLSSDAPPKAELSNELPETYDALVSAMSRAGDFVEGHKWYGTEKEQPRLTAYFTHSDEQCSGKFE